MWYRSLTGFFLLLVVAGNAAAFPEFWQVFKEHYHPTNPGTCITCHTTPRGGQRNVYGKEVQAQLGSGSTLTVAMLKAIEGKDADQDGKTNLEEIEGGALPGDPTSKPAAETPPANPPLVPLHSYHPLVVHFPIGIFIFSAFLDGWGARKKDAQMRRIARLGLGVGTLASLIAIASGVTAMLRMGLPLEGTLLIHFILGILAGLLGIGVVAIRSESARSSVGYWSLLVLSVAAIAAAGHFGASMVWG